MGMFDELTCKYPLPAAGANEVKYQTKSLDCGLDDYEIREDGSLWHEDFDREDRSTAALWQREHPGEELPEHLRSISSSLFGCLSRVNQRWVPMTDFIGEINFYGGGFDWSAYFVNGKLKELHALHDAQTDTPSQEAR